MLSLHCCAGFSLPVVSKDFSFLQCAGFSLKWLLLWRMGSSASAVAACRIFPDQGWNLCLLHWQADSLPLSHQRSPRSCFSLSHNPHPRLTFISLLLLLGYYSPSPSQLHKTPSFPWGFLNTSFSIRLSFLNASKSLGWHTTV